MDIKFLWIFYGIDGKDRFPPLFLCPIPSLIPNESIVANSIGNGIIQLSPKTVQSKQRTPSIQRSTK